jgi:hypothetical protein
MTIKIIDPDKLYQEHRLFVYAKIINSTSQSTSYSIILTIETEWGKDFTLKQIVHYISLEMCDSEITHENLEIVNISVISVKNRQR